MSFVGQKGQSHGSRAATRLNPPLRFVILGAIKKSLTVNMPNCR